MHIQTDVFTIGDIINGIIALGTLTLAIYAIVQASAAKLSARVLINSERAWIDVDIENLKTPPNPPNGKNEPYIYIKPIIKNHGNTPALISKIVVTWIQVPMGRGGKPGDLPKVPDFSGDNTATFPNLSALLVPDGELKEVGTYIPIEQFPPIRNRENSLYVYGYVEYLDTIERKSRKTCFCQLYYLQGRFDPDPDRFWKLAGDVPAAYIECN